MVCADLQSRRFTGKVFCKKARALAPAKAPKSQSNMLLAKAAIGSKLNKRLIGLVNGVYERINRVSLDYYYGGAQYQNAAVVMDKILNCADMEGYNMPCGWFDKNLVNIVFYSKDVHGQPYFASHVASELATAHQSSWMDVLRTELKVADRYTTDDTDLDYIFGRLAALVRLTYTSSRDTQYCRPKHWEPWPEQPPIVLRAHATFEKGLKS